VHPEGETRRLLEEMRAGWWASIDDVEGIGKLFIEAAGRGRALGNVFQPDLEKIAQYERKVLAQRYARLLRVLAEKPHATDAQRTRTGL
jgi:hypothetical protein